MTELIFESNMLSFFWKHTNVFIFLVFIVGWRLYYWHKDSIYSKEDRKLQIINPNYVPHARRDLSVSEQEILKRLSQEFFSKRILGNNRILKVLFFIFILFSVTCYIFIIAIFIFLALSGTMFFLSPIIIGSTIAVIKTFQTQTKYYLDLRSPVFEMTTGLLLIQNSKKYGKKYKLRDIEISELNDSKYVSKLENYPDGTLMRIEFSPHSKHIWSLDKVEL